MAALDFPYLNQVFLSRLEQQERQKDPAYQLSMKIQEASLRSMLEREAQNRQVQEYLDRYDTSTIDPRYLPDVQIARATMDPNLFLTTLRAAEERRRAGSTDVYLRKVIPGGVSVPEAIGAPEGSFASLYAMTPEGMAASPEWKMAMMQESGATGRAGIQAGATIRSAEIAAASAGQGRLMSQQEAARDNLRQATTALNTVLITAQKDWLSRTLPQRQQEAMGILTQYGRKSWARDQTWQEVFNNVLAGEEVPENVASAVEDIRFKSRYPTLEFYVQEIRKSTPELFLNLSFSARQAQSVGLSGPELEQLAGQAPGLVTQQMPLPGVKHTIEELQGLFGPAPSKEGQHTIQEIQDLFR